MPLGCAVLLTQPAPLTGTATTFLAGAVPLRTGRNPHPSRGQENRKAAHGNSRGQLFRFPVRSCSLPLTYPAPPTAAPACPHRTHSVESRTSAPARCRSPGSSRRRIGTRAGTSSRTGGTRKAPSERSSCQARKHLLDLSRKTAGRWQRMPLPPAGFSLSALTR